VEGGSSGGGRHFSTRFGAALPHVGAMPRNLLNPMMQGEGVWQNLNTIPMYMTNNGMI